MNAPQLGHRGRRVAAAVAAVLGLAAVILAVLTTAGQQRAASSPTPEPSPSSVSARPSSVKSSVGEPSKAARMICESETRENVAALIARPAQPPGKATWANRVYTCTYQLPVGALVLSVQESPNPLAARRYFNALQRSIGPTKPVTGLAGLGLPAYEDGAGKVVFLKDNATLQVNATSLPRQVGPHNTSRAAIAYTVATEVLACWTE